MKLPDKKTMNDLDKSAMRLLNLLLEEIENNCRRKMKHSDDAFTAGYIAANRNLFAFCMSNNIKPITYHGRLMLDGLYPQSKEEQIATEMAIEKARRDSII